MISECVHLPVFPRFLHVFLALLPQKAEGCPIFLQSLRRALNAELIFLGVKSQSCEPYVHGILGDDFQGPRMFLLQSDIMQWVHWRHTQKSLGFGLPSVSRLCYHRRRGLYQDITYSVRVRAFTSIAVIPKSVGIFLKTTLECLSEVLDWVNNILF